MIRVDQAKVRDYLLVPDHPDNDGKAAFFFRFGFTREAWQELHVALVAHPNLNSVVRATQTSSGGMRYRVRCNLISPDGRNPCIVSVWGVERMQATWLITAFPGMPPDPASAT